MKNTSKFAWLEQRVYFALLLDKIRGHKADYVPSSEGAARAKDFAWTRRYVEWRQGLGRRGLLVLVLFSFKKETTPITQQLSLSRIAKNARMAVVAALIARPTIRPGGK